jgi:hypothetical protein
MGNFLQPKEYWLIVEFEIGQPITNTVLLDAQN